jgi:hypothetical protein
MTDPDPRLLSGLSARTFSRLVSALIFGGFGSVALYVPFALAVGAAHYYSQRLWMLTVVVLAVHVVVVTTAVLVLAPRADAAQRRELDAGYTTLMPEFDQVDGIDPRSGRVVRPAKLASSNRSASDTITTGLQLGTVETRRTPLDVAVRRQAAVTAEIVCTFILLGTVTFFIVVVAPSGHFPDVGVAVLLLLATASLFAVILIPALVIRFAPGWYYERRLIEATPDARAFQVIVSNGNVVEELAGIDAPALPGSRWRPLSYVVCTNDHLAFYSRATSELIPYLDIPKSCVVAARPRSAISTTLVLRKDNGTTIDLTLTVGVPSYRAARKGQEARSEWILRWAHDKTAQSLVE